MKTPAIQSLNYNYNKFQKNVKNHVVKTQQVPSFKSNTDKVAAKGLVGGIISGFLLTTPFTLPKLPMPEIIAMFGAVGLAVNLKIHEIQNNIKNNTNSSNK